MEERMEFIQVSTAFEKKEDAGRLAGILLEKRLAACVQIMAVESLYRWKGRIEKASEYLCVIKTRKSLYGEIESEIIRNHPYEIPEIAALPICAGSPGYLGWIEDET
jgi:periplasmic divalent cation tolerance protein